MNENTRSDGAGQAYSRIYNRRLIFELLHQAGPLSRVDIADRIGLKPQTISGITRELLTQGLIHEVGKSVGQRGQPQTYLAPNPDAGYSLGMHVDQGRISIVLGDLLLNIRQRTEWVGETTDPAATTSVMAQLAETMILESGIEKQKIWGIGLVLPTLNADTYEAEMTMPGWDLWRGFDVAGKLGALLDLPVLMENDATAAAMAELFSHSGTPPRNAVLVYIGYGTGAGIVVDGMPMKGARGNAGELGLLPLPLCLPGSASGVIDDQLSLHAIARMLHCPVAELTRETIGTMHASRDSILMHWMETATQTLRFLVAIIETAFDPETIFLSGGFPESVLSALVERAYPLLPSLSATRDRELPRLITATLLTDGPVIGGMTLPVFVNTKPDFRHLYIRQVGSDERPFDHR